MSNGRCGVWPSQYCLGVRGRAALPGWFVAGRTPESSGSTGCAPSTPPGRAFAAWPLLTGGHHVHGGSILIQVTQTPEKGPGSAERRRGGQGLAAAARFHRSGNPSEPSMGPRSRRPSRQREMADEVARAAASMKQDGAPVDLQSVLCIFLSRC